MGKRGKNNNKMPLQAHIPHQTHKKVLFKKNLKRTNFFKTYLFKLNYILDRKKHKTHIPQVAVFILGIKMNFFDQKTIKIYAHLSIFLKLKLLKFFIDASTRIEIHFYTLLS